VIGHRGAAGHRPEHTLASYRLSILLGADYIEPDLVSTADGVLVARHENDITRTTDVAEHPAFADRRTTKVVDGREVTGWFTEDLTLAELRTLRAKERLPQVRPRNARRDGCYRIPTLDEILELATRESQRTGRRIGVYPETKHPSYFAGLGLALEEPLLAALRRHGLDGPGAPVYLQSFETANLRALRHLTPLPLVQLLAAGGAPGDLVAAGAARTYADLRTPAGLLEIASYADAIGPAKDLVLPRDPITGAAGEQSSLVADAHAAGLCVHVYTLRDENQFMATNFRRGDDPHAPGDAVAEARAFLDAGVDGLFTDHPGTAVEARGRWRAAAALAG
jgi:glycerophosphoryl diester phosphodiesterase